MSGRARGFSTIQALVDDVLQHVGKGRVTRPLCPTCGRPMPLDESKEGRPGPEPEPGQAEDMEGAP